LRALIFWSSQENCASSAETRSNFGDKALSAAGPWVWNYLPTDLRQPDLSYCSFRQSPMTFYLISGEKRRVNSPLTAL